MKKRIYRSLEPLHSSSPRTLCLPSLTSRNHNNNFKTFPSRFENRELQCPWTRMGSGWWCSRWPSAWPSPLHWARASAAGVKCTSELIRLLLIVLQHFHTNCIMHFYIFFWFQFPDLCQCPVHVLCLCRPLHTILHLPVCRQKWFIGPGGQNGGDESGWLCRVGQWISGQPPEVQWWWWHGSPWEREEVPYCLMSFGCLVAHRMIIFLTLITIYLPHPFSLQG